MSTRARGTGSGLGESVKTWTLLAGLAAAVVVWGYFLFSAVGDRGQPPWDFDAVEDVPGSSPYAVHGPKQSPTLGPGSGRDTLAPQHVGAGGNP